MTKYPPAKQIHDSEKTLDIEADIIGQKTAYEAVLKDTSDLKTIPESVEQKSLVQDLMCGTTYETSDSNQIWANLLAQKMKLMDPYKCEEFKVTVDSFALDIIKKSKPKDI